MDEEILHSPKLPDSPSVPATPVREPNWSDEEESGRFSSDSDVIDLTKPSSTSRPKKLTDYFQKKQQTTSNKMPYFLQRFRPQLPSAAPLNLVNDRVTEEPSSSKAISSPVVLKVKSKCSAVNNTYSLAKKLEVLKYVGQYSESEAARHFDIPRTTIRGWKDLDKKPVDKKMSYTCKKKGKNKAGAGRPLSYNEDFDMEICQWVLEMRDLHLPIQRKHIQRKALALIQPTHPTFKASDGWLSKFLTRHSLTLRRQTSIQQKLPAQLEMKLTKFVNDTKALRKQHRFPLDLIINMDETPVCFDMASNTTVDKRGTKEIIVRGTGAHKRHFTVTLTCTASGQMLQPFVTFKANTDRILKKIKAKETDVIVTTQSKGWMDYKLMLKWISKVLVKYTKGRHALLVFFLSSHKACRKKHLPCRNPRWLHKQGATFGC